MVLVDTTVWIDFFIDRGTPQVTVLAQLLSEGEDICICGVILTEVFQGIREDRDCERAATRFDNFLFLDMGRDTFVKSADLFRVLRRQGITIRRPTDCMIAAVAIQYGIPLLHSDRDFDPIAKHCGLRVLEA